MLQVCHEIGLTSVLISGGSGGLAKSSADYCILASANRTSTIQEMHILLVHTLCECIEKEVGNFNI